MPDALALSRKTPLWGRFSLWHASSFAGVLLLVLSWLTTEHFPPWVSWHSEVLAFCAVFLLAWTGVASQWRCGPQDAFAVPWLAVPFALFGFVALLQAATGLMSFWGDVLVVWFYMALCIACLTMGFNCAPASGEQREATAWPPAALLALAIVVACLASVAIAFAQVFDLWTDSSWIVRMFELRRPGGNLGQPNQLGTLLVMGCASTAFLYAVGRLAPPTSILVLLVLGAGLAASESRAGVLGLVALLAWWQVKRGAVAPRESRWAGPAAGTIFLALFMLWPHLLNLTQLLGAPAQSRLGNSDLRLALWSQMLEAVWQRPWAGWGIAQVAKAHNAVANLHMNSNPLSYSHNLFIDWAVWMGLPIALLLMLATAIWLVRRAKAVSSLTAWYCLAAFTPLATHSMLEFPFAYAYFLAPALFLLGILERSAGARCALRIRAIPAVLLLLPVSAALLWSVAEYLVIEEDFRIVRFEQLRIGHTPPDHHPPSIVLYDQLGALLTGSRIELRPGMSADDLNRLKRLALRYPWVATEYPYAVALALNGNSQEAIRQLQVLRAVRGETVYDQVKAKFGELAQTHYPQLRDVILP